MFVKVEPSGCVERKGLVQIRFAMYLEPSDYGYDIHHIQVPVIPEGGYQGEMVSVLDGATTIPLDQGDYNKWLDTLPKVWQTNPFHNHFIYVEPETSDDEIMDMGEAYLREAYIKWASDKKLDLKNKPVKFYDNPNQAKQDAVQAKVKHLKETKLERKI